MYKDYSSAESGSDMEANLSQIEEEEFHTALVGEIEDKREMEREREEKRRRKIRKLREEGLLVDSDEVEVSDEDSQDFF